MRIIDEPEYFSGTVTNQTIDLPSQQIEHMFGYSLQVIFSNPGIAGNMVLQSSLDNENWEDVSSSTVNISGPGSQIYNVADAMYRFVRLRITSTNGTTMNIESKFYAKGF